MSKNLRVDIQSLRGLAVLLVLLFHFFPDFFPRGYLGVDIFFVISGYLMSKVINEKINKKFSLFGFYLSRLKRILPSLILIIFVISFISLKLLLPNDFANLYESIKFTFFLIPNFYFWLNGGYFGLIDELKPLLHLWSIGVEFQFYFFIPIFYLSLIKYFRTTKVKNYIILLFLISILSNIYIDYIDGKNFSFFMPFTRLWEFLIGSLCYHFAKKSYYKHEWIIFVLFFLFLFVLLKGFNYEIYNKLFAVLFAFSIIFINSKSFYISYLLKNKFLVFLGFVSYALYLWHWPILSLFKYYAISEINLENNIILILCSIILAFLTTRYFENKFRYSSNKNYTLVFITNILLLLIVFNPQISFFKKRIFDQKILDISKSIGSNYRCSKDSYFIYGQSKACLINSDSTNINKNLKDYIALYGNSHAQMYGYAFKEILKKINKIGIIIPLNACLPTYDLNISRDCLDKSYKNFKKVMSDENIKTIIIGLNFDHNSLENIDGIVFKKDAKEKLALSLNNLIKKFLTADKKVILIGPLSTPKYNFPLDYSRNLFFDKNLNLEKNYLLEKFEIENQVFFNSFENKENFRFFLPHKVQCNNVYCEYIIDNQSLFADDNHLSKYGSLKMKNELQNELNNLK